MISIKNLSKTYASGARALENVSLEIQGGEVFGLLGPNGAGKTTLIGIISGIINKSSGEVTVGGKDIIKDWRETRKLIGLVPQEVQLDIFLSVIETLENHRGYFGLTPDPKLVQEILTSLSLWEKRLSPTRELSGGMKRRLLIAKALITEPKVLFLDEPTAGVDVELRKEMWEFIKELKRRNVTIILTTHYIEEAELLADRIGIINDGKIVLVEEKNTLMKRLGEKTLVLYLKKPEAHIPESLAKHNFLRSEDGKQLSYQYSIENENIVEVIRSVEQAGFSISDVDTKATNLEEIFVNTLHKT